MNVEGKFAWYLASLFSYSSW